MRHAVAAVRGRVGRADHGPHVELDAAITRLACVVPRDRVALVEAELIRRGGLLGDELAAVQAVTDDVARGLLW